MADFKEERIVSLSLSKAINFNIPPSTSRLTIFYIETGINAKTVPTLTLGLLISEGVVVIIGLC
jgi:hypothetical protein